MMKKKFLTVALAASMVLGSMSSAFAAETSSVELENGLTGYYTFDDTLVNAVGKDGATAKVHGGAGDTWNAAVTGKTAYAEGKNGKAYSFTGDVDGVRGEGLELDAKVTGSEYTVSLWIKASDFGIGTSSMVFANDDSSTFSVNTLNNFNGSVLMGKLWDWDNRGDTFVCLDGDNAGGFVKDTWVYLTVTSKSGEQKLYLNGVMKSEAASTNTLVVDALKDKALFLGINWWDASFGGLMDDVAVYNRALSADEVSALYKANGVPVSLDDKDDDASTDDNGSGNTENNDNNNTNDNGSGNTENNDNNNTNDNGSGDTDDNGSGNTENNDNNNTNDSGEVVKATVVTADAAKAISEAAKVTSKDGKVLDVKLTATPVEDTTVAAGLVNADIALKAAKVKAFAVLDLKLTVDGKNVTLLDEKINVNIPMDKLFADIKADAVVAVYRIDKVNDKEQLSFLGTSKVAADKTITFATEHFSQYVFAVVENAEALKDVKVVEYVKDIDTKATPDQKVADLVKADASVNPDTNKTGDTTPVMPLVVLAVVALGGVIVAVASKKRA